MKNIVLVGNPNTGKTTFFNALTKSNEHTGNWHGVTVDSMRKTITIQDEKFSIVDLPGLYSLSPNSFEEKVSVDFILSHQNSLFINVCNKMTFSQNLNLTLDMLSLGLDVILLMNDFGDNNNRVIYKQELEKYLGVNIFYNNKNTIKEIKNEILNHKINIPNKYNINNEIINNYKKNINENILQKKSINFYLNKSLCGDEYYSNFLKKYEIDVVIDENYYNLFWEQRNKLINIIVNNSFSKININYKCNKIDNIILNKYLCIPIFLLIMSLIFYLTFVLIGPYFSNLLKNFIINDIGSYVNNFVNSYVSTEWLRNLIMIAIVNGLGNVFAFLPQIVLLFLFLEILEDSGYISRLAFCFDEIFKKVGLSGKSVYTLLMGFGCSTTACITSRNMSDKNAKIKTGIITPFMSCSAKLPVYMIIGNSFFGNTNIVIISLLYLLGVIIALIASSFLEHTYLPSSLQSFILEMPSYQLPKIKKLIKTGFSSAKMFIIRIASVVFALNIIVWILCNFSFSLKYVGNESPYSVLKTIAKFISPIFIPLGFNSWGITTALLIGIVAKEMIVSTISMLNINTIGLYNSISSSLVNPISIVCFSPKSALCFMVFCLLYCPCIACFSSLRKEIGKKWTYIMLVVQFFIAYACAMLCNLCFTLMQLFGGITIIVGFLIVLLFIISLKKYKKCKKCKGCKV